MEFQCLGKDSQSKARAGVLHTDHGTIETPIFMPVGTVGTVKGVSQQQLLQQVNADIILGNTYHLYLRPGTYILQQAGGLHHFMNWPRPILTDSGGFQVFSLNQIRKIREEGVEFRSHIDGRKLMFSPESVMDIQRQIGADIIMAFDECTPYPSTYQDARSSMELTHRWLARCVKHHQQQEPLYGYRQSLFPIIQGSVYDELRKESAYVAASMECDGNAIGGLSVGEPAEQMYAMCELVCDILPADKPRYLMGVGTPANILENIALGIDMFDCVMPTRNGRNGMLFTTQGIINIRNQKWADDFSPLDPGLDQEVSLQYTKAYLRHLFVAGELLGLQLASLQNLCFYLYLVREARKAILDGSFTPWKINMLKQVSQRL